MKFKKKDVFYILINNKITLKKIRNVKNNIDDLKVKLNNIESSLQNIKINFFDTNSSQLGKESNISEIQSLLNDKAISSDFKKNKMFRIVSHSAPALDDKSLISMIREGGGIIRPTFTEFETKLKLQEVTNSKVENWGYYVNQFSLKGGDPSINEYYNPMFDKNEIGIKNLILESQTYSLEIYTQGEFDETLITESTSQGIQFNFYWDILFYYEI